MTLKVKNVTGVRNLYQEYPSCFIGLIKSLFERRELSNFERVFLVKLLKRLEFGEGAIKSILRNFDDYNEEVAEVQVKRISDEICGCLDIQRLGHCKFPCHLFKGECEW